MHQEFQNAVAQASAEMEERAMASANRLFTPQISGEVLYMRDRIAVVFCLGVKAPIIAARAQGAVRFPYHV